MTYDEYLLTKLAEECSELAQVASKMNVFGIYSHDPNDPTKTTNQQHMNIEFNDILAVIDMLKETMMIDVDRDEKLIEIKRIKMDRMWQISKLIKGLNDD